MIAVVDNRGVAIFDWFVGLHVQATLGEIFTPPDVTGITPLVKNVGDHQFPVPLKVVNDMTTSRKAAQSGPNFLSWPPHAGQCRQSSNSLAQHADVCRTLLPAPLLFSVNLDIAQVSPGLF
jgi:hypothetical protein